VYRNLKNLNKLSDYRTAPDPNARQGRLYVYWGLRPKRRYYIY